MHGVVVGGGVALSLQTHERLGPPATTVSFGNLSRGAVPGMRLSVTLRRAHGLVSSMSLYQRDSLIDMSDALGEKLICCLTNVARIDFSL